MRQLILVFLLLAGTPLPAADEPAHSIVAEAAWIREAPPGGSPLAGYMTLKNIGQESVKLTGVTSPLFARIEIHQSRIEGDVAKMEQKNSLTLKSGQSLSLAPGGYHLMLFNPERELRAGDRVSLTLNFKDQEPLTINAELRSLRIPDTDHSHHHH